ncbi:MAG: GH25 family lysozyme, partial [Polyangiaceae bacterium]
DGYAASSSDEEALTKVCGQPTTGPVQGYDVSTYQGAFTWAGKGVQFGAARISDGMNSIDSQFDGNWSRMKAAGVLRSAYQFFEPGQDEVAQANMVIAKVGKLGPSDLPVMLDVEATGGQSPATIQTKAQHWLDLVEAGTGKRPFVYSYGSFLETNLGSGFGKYPLWIANYGPTCPSVPNGWTNWVMWQYSDGSGSLDHDVFNGTLAQLQALASSGGPQYPVLVHKRAVDINGDGSADTCGRAGDGITCSITAKGATTPTVVNGPAWSDAAGWNKPEYYLTIQGADVDGDGKGDLCARDGKGIVCEISNGNGFTSEIRGPAWSDANGWNAEKYYSTIRFADVNGDGKADVCGRASTGMICELSNGTGFPTEIAGPAWTDAAGWDKPQYYQTIELADVNGDARMDLCARSGDGITCSTFDGTAFSTPFAGPAWSDAAGWSKPEYMETIRWADVDGDGKADVCGRAAVGVVCELSNGTGFPTELKGPEWSDVKGWNASQYYTTIQTADVNGDGKADLCARGGNGIVCEVSDGKGFPTEIVGPDWSTAQGWDPDEFSSTVGFADLDDDGKDDVCARGWAGIQCALSTGTAFGAPVTGPEWSDPKGWGTAEYYSTIRYGGARLHPLKTAPQGGGGVVGDGGAGGVGGSAGGSAQANANADDDSGCGCTTVGTKSDSSLGLFGLALGLALVAARRRSAKRAA